MPDVSRLPASFWRLMRFVNRRVARAYRPKLPIANMVLLLTTTGRRSGRPRVTPLQYEEIDGAIYVAAARGPKADWYRNIIANPRVEVQVQDRDLQCVAEPITIPARIADFLEFRMEHHPKMIGAMLRLHGLPARPTRANLEQLAASLALVVIRPWGCQERADEVDSRQPIVWRE